MMRPLLLASLLSLTCLVGCSPEAESKSMLSQYVEARLQEAPPAERQALLRPLAESIAAQRAKGEPVELVFICTHNSRRSHLSQVWAQTGAAHFGLDGIQTFSGGTEATAFNPRAVAALERAGFTVDRGPEEENPVYTVRGDGDLAMQCFSKKFQHPENPQSGFTAVMTCSDADEACPVVPGAATRFAITYVDPKVSDGTPEESATYDARCAQIASEMLWVLQAAAR